MTGTLHQRPTLLLLPGLLCDEHVWLHQIAALNDHCEIIVPQFIAFRSIEAMAEHALALASGGFALCGHSLGGRVALEMLRQAPGRAERLVLVELAQRQGMGALAGEWLPPMVPPELDPGGEIMAGLAAMVERMTPEIFENQQVALLDRPDAGPVLSSIRCPVRSRARSSGFSRTAATCRLSRHPPR